MCRFTYPLEGCHPHQLCSFGWPIPCSMKQKRDLTLIYYHVMQELQCSFMETRPLETVPGWVSSWLWFNVYITDRDSARCGVAFSVSFHLLNGMLSSVYALLFSVASSMPNGTKTGVLSAMKSDFKLVPRNSVILYTLIETYTLEIVPLEFRGSCDIMSISWVLSNPGPISFTFYEWNAETPAHNGLELLFKWEKSAWACILRKFTSQIF